MNSYHYLVSSLKDLNLHQPDKPVSEEEFLDFSRELMDPADFADLRLLYIWNDFTNAYKYKKAGDPFSAPAYYEENNYLELLGDTERSLPFLRNYLADRDHGKKEFPGLSEADAIAALFFRDLPEIGNGFLKEYFEFELDLRNLATAISLKDSGVGYNGKMIPFGKAYELLTEKGFQEDELASEFHYYPGLLAEFEKAEPVLIEKAIDAVRWNRLDEAVENDPFSADAVMSYALRLRIIHRWTNLDKQKGKKLFDDLVGIIKRSIRFSIEFSTEGEKRT